MLQNTKKNCIKGIKVAEQKYLNLYSCQKLLLNQYMIKLILKTIRPTKPLYNYHLLTLLQTKHQQQFVKSNPALFKLYLHKLLHSPFDERYTVLMIMDCYRSSQSHQHFKIIVQHALKHLNQFRSRTSLVNLLLQMYHCKYNNKEEVIKVTIKALKIKEEQDSRYSYFNLKLLISADLLVGIQNIDQTLLREIDFKKFRPLMLAMTIEIFYVRELQNKLKLVDDLVDMFVACESFIPFADMYHLSYSIRKINNEKFKQCYYRVRRRMELELGGKQMSQSLSIKEEFSEERLKQNFRQAIINKYRVDF